MKRFFDYVFYSIYWWNRKLDASFNKIFPVGTDALFSAAWGLAFLHAINLYATYYGLICLLNLREQMFRVDYALYVLFVFCFIFDYYYYIRLKNYTSVFAKYKKKNINIAGALIYLILSVLIAGVTVLWALDKI